MMVLQYRIRVSRNQGLNVCLIGNIKNIETSNNLRKKIYYEMVKNKI